MKHLYSILFFLSCYVSFAQYQAFQIELVDSLVGQSLSNPPDFYSNESNDDGLNQIFQAHNVTGYERFYPSEGVPNTYIPQDGHFNLVICDSCDAQVFLNELNDYNAVVKYASADQVDGIVNNVLTVGLVDSNVGLPISIDNELVLTNDDTLNLIFSDYNVRSYGLIYNDMYSLVCSCDAMILKNELEAYNTVIASVSFQIPYFLLSLDENRLDETKIHPNPFIDKVNINANAQISELVVYDVLGKEFFRSNSISVLENFSLSLNSGVYIIKLFDSDKRSITRKLIKQ